MCILQHVGEILVTKNQPYLNRFLNLAHFARVLEPFSFFGTLAFSNGSVVHPSTEELLARTTKLKILFYAEN